MLKSFIAIVCMLLVGAANAEVISVAGPIKGTITKVWAFNANDDMCDHTVGCVQAGASSAKIPFPLDKKRTQQSQKEPSPTYSSPEQMATEVPNGLVDAGGNSSTVKGPVKITGIAVDRGEIAKAQDGSVVVVDMENWRLMRSDEGTLTFGNNKGVRVTVSDDKTYKSKEKPWEVSAIGFSSTNIGSDGHPIWVVTEPTARKGKKTCKVRDRECMREIGYKVSIVESTGAVDEHQKVR